jgi:hypothetical protein
LVHNVLVDTGSAVDIIFAKAFRQMQEPEDKIHDATHPLFGFGGRQIVALGKMTMSVIFGYVHNTRSEQVVFDIVDMEYPYNAIIGRGTLNAFEAILHPAYLCMKILLGRRRTHYPSLQAFVTSQHQRRQDDWRGPPFVLLAVRRRPTTKSLHLTSSHDLETHVGFGPL